MINPADHLGLVGLVVKKLGVKNIEDSEEFGDGCVCLVGLVKNFNPEKGKISTYAIPSIYKYIMRKKCKNVLGLEYLPHDKLESSPDYRENDNTDAKEICDLIFSLKLPMRHQKDLEMLRMRFIHGMTSTEIAKLVGMTKQNVLLRIKIIRELLARNSKVRRACGLEVD